MVPAFLAALPIIGKLIGEVIPDKDLATKLEARIAREMMSHDSELVKAQSAVITAEAQSEGWFAQNWRPITMLAFVTIIINNFIVAPYAAAFGYPLPTLEIPEGMWDLLTLGIGGYIGGRSLEKLATTVANAGGVKGMLGK